MATGMVKSRCIICEKEKATSKCSGCLKDFCFNHLVKHCQQLDELENRRNVFRQTLTEQTTQPQRHSLIEQINQWKEDSIEKIRHTNENVIKKLTEELKVIREANDFNRIDLLPFEENLKELEEELAKPSNV